MELKIFQRKNVSFINMLEFLLKALVLFDTSSLYTCRPKMASQVGAGSTEVPPTNTNTNANANATENESVDSGAGGYKGKLLHYKSELITYFNKGTDAVKNKIAYLMSFIAFASIYPALPFFVVLATLYGLLKWLFSKIRML